MKREEQEPATVILPARMVYQSIRPARPVTLHDQFRACPDPVPRIIPFRQAMTGAAWVTLGALIGLILTFGALLMAAWWAV